MRDRGTTNRRSGRVLASANSTPPPLSAALRNRAEPCPVAALTGRWRHPGAYSGRHLFHCRRRPMRLLPIAALLVAAPLLLSACASLGGDADAPPIPANAVESVH